MPYAIPANIRYEERLVGPLTIKQSLYLAFSLVGAWMIYNNEGIPEVARLLGALFLTGIGLGLAFANLDVWARNYFNFMRQAKKTSWISPAARKLMNIQSIRADTVFLKDHGVLGLIGVKPINFGVLSEQDKDTVIYGFLEFLNSLNFPIQIVMRSVNLDLEDYLTHLKRRITQRDDKVALAYYEHFAEYMRSYIKINKINDRHFYVVVPGKKKKTEKETIDYLTTQCNEIMARLGLSGIVAERLNTNQLINFYSSYFTETFEIYESYISPITLYRKMWREAPKMVNPKHSKGGA
ncbi:MAG: hypothetical protein ABIH11_02695 [Candidatus Altiarchaeota archaeon]